MSTPALADVAHGSVEACRTVELAGGGTPDPERLAALCRERLRANVAHCLADEVDGEIAGSTAMTAMLGRMAEYLDGTTEVAPRHVMPIVTFLGAMTSQWRLNGLFLDHVADHTGLEVTTSERTFRALSREWMKVYQIFLFGFHAGRSPHAMLRRTLGRMRQMAVAERQALRVLSDALGARPERRGDPLPDQAWPVSQQDFVPAHDDLDR
jgi:hypothetical protein